MSADLASVSDQDEMDFIADISSLVTTVNVYNRLSVVVVCLFCSNDSICTMQVSGRGVGVGDGFTAPWPFDFYPRVSTWPFALSFVCYL